MYPTTVYRFFDLFRVACSVRMVYREPDYDVSPVVIFVSSCRPADNNNEECSFDGGDCEWTTESLVIVS